MIRFLSQGIKKTAPEGAVLHNPFWRGLLAILQLDEDLAVATVLAVERLDTRLTVVDEAPVRA